MFLSDGLTEEFPVTYGRLDAEARAVAAALLARGARGQRVLLAFPDGGEYVAAFFGCLYAGAIAVPVYPPSLTRPDPRFQVIVDDAAPVVVLTSAAFLAQVQRRFASLPELARIEWLATDGLPVPPAQFELPTPLPADVAFLQYTSGSTAAPKGVMVTHGNLVANVRLLKEMFAMSAESSVVSWLPMYHDMGLVGTIILPVYVGAPCYKMSPAAFLQRPMRWLQAITRYRGRITAGPNFAYDLCVSKATPEVLAELDLSGWQVAVTGAEPVRAETMERFTRTFAPCGFKEATFHPSYGLAEATLIVSGKRGAVLPGTLAVDRAVLVSCGRPAPETTVRIIDAEDHTVCEPGRVGEVWVSGPAVAAGYWQRTEETARTFGNVLDGQRYLRTGDLGFIHEGELYITGRLKDLMIIRGQ
ncbi:MAG TPA: fatty acyl-AMP ligase, partial [Symbiobacteriaceae bacterium]|nr:fatty acyl-AMP ligase [Symbiobacteriaceae bacterium]